jgi:hypothetical protein
MERPSFWKALAPHHQFAPKLAFCQGFGDKKERPMEGGALLCGREVLA